MFSRVDQLATSDLAAELVITSAELTFWEQARTGAWLAWNDSGDCEATPPHWEAAFGYLEAVVPAYVACGARLVRHPSELEQYIDVCVSELTGRAFQYKILCHSRTPYWTSARARRRFEQAARNRLATPLADFRAKAWRSGSRVTLHGHEALKGFGTEHTGAIARSVGSNGNEDLPTPVERRQQVVADHKRSLGRTVLQICNRARVNRSDFYKWVKGQLPDTSAKSVRIEHELRSAPAVCPHE
jgi:hypothetical protein